MWCGVADIPGMPSSTARDEWGAVTLFQTFGNTGGKTVLRVISAADRPLAGNLMMARKKLAV